jgi:putative tryptophan/tyrosine transport system substrate-binding protein
MLLPYAATDDERGLRDEIFRRRLAELGWVEGRNLRIDVRHAGDAARLKELALELVALGPDVILVQSTVPAQALRDATRTIPIVFVNLGDPVRTGIVSNLARPEANITGFMLYEYSMAGKWLSLLKDVAPRLKRVAVLFNPRTLPQAPFFLRSAQEAGERLAVEITAASVHDMTGIEPAIAALPADEGGLLVLPDAYVSVHQTTTIALAAKYRIPAIYGGNRIHAAAGGLMSYGADSRLQYRDGAHYVDRILRGAKVAELPVQFATKFNLVINLKTAKALGLDISQQFQSLADEVIE